VAHRGLVATNAAAGSDTHLDWTNVTQPGNTICGRIYLYRSGPETDTKGVWALIGPSGIVSKAWLFPTGLIGIYIDANVTRVARGTVPIPIGQWVRVEWRYTIDGSGNGTAEMWTYLNADSTVHDDYQTSATVAWPGGKPRDVEFHVGRDATSQWYVDEVAVSDIKVGSAFPQKIVQVGTVTEADTARPVTARKVGRVAQAGSVEAALPIRPVKTRRIGQAAETGTAGSVTGRKIRPVGAAHDTGSAAVVTPAHRLLVGQALEADQAHEMTSGTFIGLAVEADQALPITPRKVRLVGQAFDVGVAGLVRPGRARTIGPATETALAAPMGRRKIRFVGVSVEVGQARPVRLLGREVTGVDGPRRTWSAILSRRWSAESPRRTWSASRT
jgi:hypothetical protein